LSHTCSINLISRLGSSEVSDFSLSLSKTHLLFLQDFLLLGAEVDWFSRGWHSLSETRSLLLLESLKILLSLFELDGLLLDQSMPLGAGSGIGFRNGLNLLVDAVVINNVDNPIG